MKKFIFVLAVALVATLSTSNLNAQDKGQLGAGLNFEVATGEDYTNFGIGAKFQWNIIQDLRFEPSVTYFFKKNYSSEMSYMANFHYTVNLVNNFYVYPIVGIGATTYKTDISSLSGSTTEFAFNVGAGAEFMLTANVGVCFEYKYKVVSESNRSHITLGCVYKF